MAKWTDAEINALPDSAFAVIAPGGKKDKSGRTSPRTLRYFPHHGPNGAVDKPHVDNAASRLANADLDLASDLKAKAEAHIEAHQKELGEDVESKSANPGLERRFVVQEVRLATRDDGPDGTATTFEGYAALFNSRTWIGPPKFGFWEQIAPGAFRDAIANNADVVCLFNHDMNYLLGRTASGTLQLREDDHGLWTVDDLPATQLGRDLAVQVARGDVRGMSFSFSIPPGGERWEVLPDGSELRTLTTVGELLFDVSPVVSPAYTDTTASVRAAELGRRNAPVLEGVQSGDKVSDEDVDDGDKGSGGTDDGNARAIDEPEDWRELNDRYQTYVMSLRGGDGGPLF